METDESRYGLKKAGRPIFHTASTLPAPLRALDTHLSVGRNRLASVPLAGQPAGHGLEWTVYCNVCGRYLVGLPYPFGLHSIRIGTDVDYDPVCFDLSSRNKTGDCRIVKIDHEEILCNNRIRVVAELAKSFQQLVENTIEL